MEGTILPIFLERGDTCHDSCRENETWRMSRFSSLGDLKKYRQDRESTGVYHKTANEVSLCMVQNAKTKNSLMGNQ